MVIYSAIAVLLLLLLPASQSLGADNVCLFHVGGKIFSLLYLQSSEPYVIKKENGLSIMMNFCHSFVPQQCQGTNYTQEDETEIQPAYSFVLEEREEEDKDGVSNQSYENGGNHIIQQRTRLKQLIPQLQSQQQVSQPQPQFQPQPQPQPQQPQPQLQHNSELPHPLVLLQQQQQPATHICTRYSSNSYLYLYQPTYTKEQNHQTLVIKLFSSPSPSDRKTTEVHIRCSDQEFLNITESYISEDQITIYAKSVYGCPVFQISSLWHALTDNLVILGIILFVLGFQLLFYGLVMIHVTIFISSYFMCFVVLGAIATIFLGPGSSLIAIYFTLLLILLLSTIMAYGITRLVDVSIFFIGAFFGFILGALINSVFSKIFDIYTVWTLVFFEVFCTIPFGLLTFKYSNQIIILSTSLTGSYLVIRPISWLIGGFPNEFVLYDMVESRHIDSVPWSFFIYLFFIIALAIVGSCYQFLKIKRQNPNELVQVNFIQEQIQEPIDIIKAAVDKIIARHSGRSQAEQYLKMNEMKEPSPYVGNGREVS